MLVDLEAENNNKGSVNKKWNPASGCSSQLYFSIHLIFYVLVYTTDDSAHDLPILANQSQYIAWAIGPRAVEEGLGNLAFFHTEYPRNGMLCVNYLV